jgi:D-threo-aldose 1-dehydrogenase
MDAAAPVQLGRADLVVTRLGLGLAPIGGLYEPVGDDRAGATVDRAWERGLRLFDTAPPVRVRAVRAPCRRNSS